VHDVLEWVEDGRVSESPDALAAALEVVGDRWTLLLVNALLDGPQRFGDLDQALRGLSTNVLSNRLRRLEGAGLVSASPYQERPRRFSYTLTPAGRELAGVLAALAQWGARLDHDDDDVTFV
jgi:DNA-binding HxlR family transcriptional regulator